MRADRATLQLIANKMSILHWLRMLSQVRCGLLARVSYSQGLQPTAVTPCPAPV